MAAALEQHFPSAPAPLQRFHAHLASQMVTLLQQEGSARAVQVVLLASQHLALAGLHYILEGVAQELNLVITAAGSRDSIIKAIRQGQADILICDPATLADAEVIVRTHPIPLLVYASVAEAAAVLVREQNVVVGPTTSQELTQAIQAVLRGESYRPKHLEGLLSLSARQRTIIRLFLQGLSDARIAVAIGISEHRLRHLFTELYNQLGLAHTRAALLAWANEAPLHLFDGIT